MLGPVAEVVVLGLLAIVLFICFLSIPVFKISSFGTVRRPLLLSDVGSSICDVATIATLG